jgi:thiamine transporter ThiT
MRPSNLSTNVITLIEVGAFRGPTALLSLFVPAFHAYPRTLSFSFIPLALFAFRDLSFNRISWFSRGVLSLSRLVWL